jgi:hypothetical protein
MYIRRVILCFVLVFCLIQITSAYAVKTVAVSPSSSPHAGDTVSVKTVMTFQGSGGAPFDPDHALLFATDLDQAAWRLELSRDGVADPAIAASGRTARIDGRVLASTSVTPLVCTVYVDGVAPSVTESSAVSAITIQETDSNGVPVAGGEYRKKITIDTSATLDTRIQEKEATLATIRLLIDSKARLGVDTSAAEAKYRDAHTSIASAKTASTSSVAYTDLARAHASMGEACLLLDLAVER